MRNRLIASIGVVVFGVALSAQDRPVKCGARAYRVARTAWGDPDLSGNYTNKLR